MNARHRTSQRGVVALLGALALLGCRTGADGDPWESLYSTTDEQGRNTTPRATDDETTDDETTDDQDEGPTDELSGGSNPGLETEPEPDDVSPADSRCAMEKELCNGVDDNCNGVVDEGFSCPTETNLALGGVAFDGGVYFLGNTSSDGRGDAAIQRFWPSVAEDYLTGIGPFARSHRFRRSDWQLFYLDNQALQGQVDGALETPGCPASAVEAFDFDEDNTLYYLCDEVLHRGAGEVIAEDVWRMLGVTDDGRVLADTIFGDWGHFHDGEFHAADIEISVGNAYIATMIQHDRAVIVVLRDDEVVDSELMLLQFDEQSHWSVLRRIQSEHTGGGWAGLTDGTLFISQFDPDASDQRRFLALLPDGSEQPAWRGADATDVFFGGGFLLGPRDPADILR